MRSTSKTLKNNDNIEATLSSNFFYNVKHTFISSGASFETISFKSYLYYNYNLYFYTL